MVSVASARPRPTEPSIARKPRRPLGTYVLIAIPAVLAATFLWQIASGLFHTEVATRQAVAVGQVTLEGDPLGSRVDFVLVDRVGQDTTADASVNVRLREPDGTVWQTTRSLADSDYVRLPDTSLLAGRTGYSVLVPASDWARPPRQGGLATVSVTVTPNDDSPSFSTDAQQRFP